MLLTQLSISNYKSLREVTLTPDQFCVIVGANAAGKSNFADCIDFISEVYRHGLEMAVERKGGYANIAFRRQRRSKLPIEIRLTVEVGEDELAPGSRKDGTKRLFKIEHYFAFAVQGASIRAPYQIVEENLTVREREQTEWKTVGSVKRTSQTESKISVLDERKREKSDKPTGSRLYSDALFDFSRLELIYDKGMRNILASELLITSLGFVLLGMREVVRELGSMRVFQISPSKSREVGVPTPGPEIDRWGGNLPAVVDAVSKNSPSQWDLVMETMTAILPDLTGIDVDYTPSRRLSLFFREAETGTVWSVEEVSDGTIQTLALLMAITDPSVSLVVVEEIENSVHPWIIRRVLDVCRESSTTKQIILTTHSPIVINSVRPEDVRVIWRERGESHLAELTKLDPNFLSLWEAGSLPTFEYINSGVLSQTIPPMPDLQSEAGQAVEDLYEKLHTFIMSLGDDVKSKELKYYIAFRRAKNFACVEISERMGRLRIYIKVDPETINLEKGFTRDVRDISHWGTGDLEITVRTDEDLARSQPLIRRSYMNDPVAASR